MEKFINLEKEIDYTKLKEIAKTIKNGGIVIFPTETVYGIGTNGLDKNAVKKLYNIKKRRKDKPISLLVSDIEMVEKITKDINEIEYKLMKEFFPGPFTIILKRKKIIPDIITSNQETVGIRIPKGEIARKLVEYSKVPIAAPSANISGMPSGTTAKEIDEQLKNKVDYIIDAGKSDLGISSTIVQVIDNIPHILRKGVITAEQIKQIAGEVVCDYEKIELKEEIRKKLFELSDEKYKQFHSTLCPGSNNIIGVRVPILRKYAKQLYEEKNNWQQILDIKPYYAEEIMLQGMMIGFIKNKVVNKEKNIEKVFEYIENFIPYINNWAICDTFCAGLKITKKYPEEMWKFIDKYLKSTQEFELRFGIVMLLDYYITEGYIDKIFKIIENIKHEGYYVKMAIAWLLSICYIKYPQKTLKYLKNTNIDDFTYNKSLQKIIESYRVTQDDKEIIRKMKRG